MCDLPDQKQITYSVKNFGLHRLAGEIPAQDVLPSIWVADQDTAKALEFIKAPESAPSVEVWFCQCGETNEGQFSSCWNCCSDRI